MSSRESLKPDPVDIYIGHLLKNWVAHERPPERMWSRLRRTMAVPTSVWVGPRVASHLHVSEPFRDPWEHSDGLLRVVNQVSLYGMLTHSGFMVLVR